MKKKKIFLIVVSVILVCLIFTIYSAYNHKVINNDYNQLTITKMGETIHVIQDKKKISEVIERISNSPREFLFPNSSFKYDYLPHGILVFENESEKKKKELGIVYLENDEVNVIMDYWEIKTVFDFSNSIK